MRRRPHASVRAIAGATLVLSVAGAGSAWASLASSTAPIAATISSGRLTAPSGLAGSCQPASSNVVLTWSAPTSTFASGYEVLEASAKAGPFSVVGTVSGESTLTFTATVPLLATRYFEVLATRNAWTGPVSNELTVTSIALGICTTS
jgi:hypothetical protein